MAITPGKNFQHVIYPIAQENGKLDTAGQQSLDTGSTGDDEHLSKAEITTGGVVSSATFMLKQILIRQGLDPSRDVAYIYQSGGTQLGALLSGSVDAIILGVQPRYMGVNAGMRELFSFGNEVKNSWGTLATSDRFIKEPKQVAGFMRAAVKALRFIRQERNATIAANVKFSGVDRTPADS